MKKLSLEHYVSVTGFKSPQMLVFSRGFNRNISDFYNKANDLTLKLPWNQICVQKLNIAQVPFMAIWIQTLLV